MPGYMKDEINFHGFMTMMRQMHNVTLEQVCDGLCTVSMTKYFLMQQSALWIPLKNPPIQSRYAYIRGIFYLFITDSGVQLLKGEQLAVPIGLHIAYAFCGSSGSRHGGHIRNLCLNGSLS